MKKIGDIVKVSNASEERSGEIGVIVNKTIAGLLCFDVAFKDGSENFFISDCLQEVEVKDTKEIKEIKKEITKLSKTIKDNLKIVDKHRLNIYKLREKIVKIKINNLK